jgi:hypothetical protein
MCSKNLEDLRKDKNLIKCFYFLFSVNLYLCVYNFLIAFWTFFFSSKFP